MLLIACLPVGASADAPSKQLRTKAAGEEAVLAAFPNATIIRPAPIVRMPTPAPPLLCTLRLDVTCLLGAVCAGRLSHVLLPPPAQIGSEDRLLRTIASLATVRRKSQYKCHWRHTLSPKRRRLHTASAPPTPLPPVPSLSPPPPFRPRRSSLSSLSSTEGTARWRPWTSATWPRP